MGNLSTVLLELATFLLQLARTTVQQRTGNLERFQCIIICGWGCGGLSVRSVEFWVRADRNKETYKETDKKQDKILINKTSHQSFELYELM